MLHGCLFKMVIFWKYFKWLICSQTFVYIIEYVCNCILTAAYVCKNRLHFQTLTHLILCSDLESTVISNWYVGVAAFILACMCLFPIKPVNHCFFILITCFLLVVVGSISVKPNKQLKPVSDGLPVLAGLDRAKNELDQHTRLAGFACFFIFLPVVCWHPCPEEWTCAVCCSDWTDLCLINICRTSVSPEARFKSFTGLKSSPVRNLQLPLTA